MIKRLLIYSLMGLVFLRVVNPTRCFYYVYVIDCLPSPYLKLREIAKTIKDFITWYQIGSDDHYEGKKMDIDH